MKQSYVYGLAVLLAAIGLSLIIYKWQVLGFPVGQDQEVPVWTFQTLVLNIEKIPAHYRKRISLASCTN